MNNIFERISAVRTNFYSRSIKQPNVIYMNMADYRLLCEWAGQQSMVACNDTGGIYGEVAVIDSKPIEILGMRIVKKAGANLECRTDTQPTKDCVTAENIRKLADSMRAAGVKLPRCGHGLIRAYCPWCKEEEFSHERTRH